ncbi:LysM peptidoglycan-binding domain-containing protein [Nesterenkonia suensis]
MRPSHASFTSSRSTASPGDAGHSAPAGQGTTVTLTRRGRLLFVGLPALVLLAAALVGLALLVGSFTNLAQASGQEALGVEAIEVTVTPGDTLWSVASRVDSEEDIQVLITRIAELNDLSSSELHPGQTLDVPVVD